MGFWDKSVAIFKFIRDHGRQSVQRIAEQTGFSKSSVHRLGQAINRRSVEPESWFWETDDGRAWLKRLVVATLYLFGLKRSVGVETISDFFTRLHLHRHVGSSPSAIRQAEIEALDALAQQHQLPSKPDLSNTAPSRDCKEYQRTKALGNRQDRTRRLTPFRVLSTIGLSLAPELHVVSLGSRRCTSLDIQLNVKA